MPVNASVVSSWHDGVNAFLAVRFHETGGPLAGDTEYVGVVPLRDAQGNDKPLPQLRQELIAACRQRRLDHLGRGQTPVGGFPGTVDIG